MLLGCSGWNCGGCGHGYCGWYCGRYSGSCSGGFLWYMRSSTTTTTTSAITSTTITTTRPTTTYTTRSTTISTTTSTTSSTTTYTTTYTTTSSTQHLLPISSSLYSRSHLTLVQQQITKNHHANHYTPAVSITIINFTTNMSITTSNTISSITAYAMTTNSIFLKSTLTISI